jgi:predicted porin
MNKRLISAVVASAALVPGVVCAQSSVTIGGIMDAGVRRDSGSTTGSSNSVGSGLSQTSRITFSGIEDMGGGLKAGFVLEAGVALDTGAGASNPPGVSTGAFAFGRTSAVALGSDSAGFISLGRQYTPIWAVVAGPMNDPFGGSWLGGAPLLYNKTVITSNSVVYSYGYTAKAMLLPAPKTGLGAAVMLSAPETPSSSTVDNSVHAGQQFGFNLSYGAGPWWAALAYHQVKGSNSYISATAPVSANPLVKQDALTGSYDFGFARLHLGLNWGKGDAYPLTKTLQLDRQAWDIGATVPIGDHQTVRMIYGVSNDKTLKNADYKSFQIGYQYNFSKRTLVYTGYGQLNNENSAAGSPVFALTGAQGTYGVGSTGRSVIMGIKQFF